MPLAATALSAGSGRPWLPRSRSRCRCLPARRGLPDPAGVFAAYAGAVAALRRGKPPIVPDAGLSPADLSQEP
eukprot:7483431-Alexandrium_andersonii.AAC.1